MKESFFDCNDDNYSALPSPPHPEENIEFNTDFQTKNNNQNKKEENKIKENESIKEKKKEEYEKIEENNNENYLYENLSIIIENNMIINHNTFKETNVIINQIYTIEAIIKIFDKNNNLDKFKNILNKYKNNEINKNNILNGHDKYSTDNIIKKIKNYLIKSLIKFVNSELIGTNVYKKSILKKLDYKFTSNINKEDNIICLKMTIKELLSFEISKKYTTQNKNRNEIIIQKMLKKGKKDEKIQYVFNLKFKEWIDIFTMKKENTIAKIDGLYLLLNKILKTKEGDIDEVYFVKFVYYLYNFENWFLYKKDRTRKNAK